MQENTFELIPLKTILTKKIITNEAKTSKERMELPNGWKFLCNPYSLEYLQVRKHGSLFFFKMIGLCSLFLIFIARVGE